MMGGRLFEDDCELLLPRTLVLVGKTGNGKSATGNTILGKKLLKSKRSSSSVTKTSELKKTKLEDGQILSIIDTPGLFDSSIDFEFIGKEIVSCINMAKDGIDAFLFVISVCNRFAEDEHAAISSLLTLFGENFLDYMIIVFTGGDELEDDNESLEEFLDDSPIVLQKTLRQCGNRCVLFDNKTKDPTKRSNQVQKLLALVNTVSKSNRGIPFTNEIFTELEKLNREHEKEEKSLFDKQLKGIYEMIEAKLKETTLKFEKLWEEERSARLKSEEEIKKLREELEEERKKRKQERKKREEDPKKKEEDPKKKGDENSCNIL